MNQEIWKDIPGYIAYYQASNTGKVRSVDRSFKDKRGYHHNWKGKELSPCKDRKGYLIVALTKNSKSRTYPIHKLVAMSFLNHKPCGMKLVIDHIDDNRLNNCPSNLQILTNRQNITKNRGDSLGAYRSRNKWESRITINGHCFRLGYFETKEDAHNAYMGKLKEVQIEIRNW